MGVLSAVFVSIVKLIPWWRSSRVAGKEAESHGTRDGVKDAVNQ
jgi:hypothetical protein